MSFERVPNISPELFTFQDAVERLQIASGAQGTGYEDNAARMAVMDALRELPAKHDWAYYKRAFQVTTQAPETGLVGSYDHTGGTYERELTLTTGTWPSNATDGQIILSDNLFKIEKRISDTVVQLSVDSNPGQDVSSTTFSWVRTSYSLGQRIRRLLYLAEAANDVPLSYVDQAALVRHLRTTPQVSTPIIYNIHQTGGVLGEMEIEFAPPPMDARSYILAVEAQPRSIRTVADEFTVSVSGTTVTASSGTFYDYHKGAIIRLRDDQNTPTGKAGATSLYNPFLEQAVITSVDSTTQVTIANALSGTYAGVSAIVTDPIDIDPVQLWDYFFALCRRKYSQYSPVGTKVDEQLGLERMAFNQAVSNNPYISTDVISQMQMTGVPDIDFILEFPITG